MRMYLRLVFKYVNAYMYFVRGAISFYAALADQTRLRLLYLIRNGEVCVCHLQNVLRTNQPKVSRHLAYLRRSSLVEARRDGKWSYYRLKKLDGALQRILLQTMESLKNEPQIKKDSQRLKQILSGVVGETRNNHCP
jgi:ArsR family transcriptional regulator